MAGRGQDERGARGVVILDGLPARRSMPAPRLSTLEERRSVNAQNARTTKRPAPKGKRRFLTRKRILLTLLALFLAGVATVAVAWVAIGIPTPNQLAEAQASIVYYSDGKTEMDRITQVDGNRESVPLSKVPVHVQHALLAAEDRSFYQNKGVSPTGIGRALVAAVKGGPTQGGVHDHPAVRQELLPHPGPDPDPQGQGADHLAQDRPAEVQVRDPGRLPQHHLLRPRRLRHPDRVQGVLRQGRLPAHGERGRPAGVGHPRPGLLRPLARRAAEEERAGPGRTTCSTGW